MSLNIKNPETHQLVQELAQRTGESLTEAVAEIQAFVSTLPDRDTRSAEEILGYDDHGLPG